MHIALAEDRSLVPRPHVAAYNHLSLLERSDTLFWPLTHTHMHALINFFRDKYKEKRMTANISFCSTTLKYQKGKNSDLTFYTQLKHLSKKRENISDTWKPIMKKRDEGPLAWGCACWNFLGNNHCLAWSSLIHLLGILEDCQFWVETRTTPGGWPGASFMKAACLFRLMTQQVLKMWDYAEISVGKVLANTKTCIWFPELTSARVATKLGRQSL